MRTTMQKEGLRRRIVLTLAAQGGESARNHSMPQVSAGRAGRAHANPIDCIFEVTDVVTLEVRIAQPSTSGNRQLK